MIIVDTALQQRVAQERPLQVAMFGAGFMARGVANQLLRRVPGFRLAVICNRTVASAIGCYTAAGVPREQIVEVNSASALDDAIGRGLFAVSSDPAVLGAERIEIALESTGHVEYGARITLLAIEHRKPMVSMNVELDATVGPILKVMADRAGIMLTGCDGDQPAVQINLHRYVSNLGLKPLICGNIKGMQDRYRNPTTQAGFAKQWGQTASMVTSFADGTKISFEQAITANATGMSVARRGMIGLEHKGHVDQLVGAYDYDHIRALGGVADYVVGSVPSPGVFVFAEAQDDIQAIYLNYGKLGEGPVYSFYTPWHLTALEVSTSLARVALLKDAPITPLGPQLVDVIAIAKKPLKAGDVLDGLGEYMTYGVCETAAITARERLLPMGLAEGCKLLRDIPQDQAIGWADVSPPLDKLAHRLRREQDQHFSKSSTLRAPPIPK